MSDKFMIDRDSVRSLADLLNETELNEIEYQVGTHRIRVVKGGLTTVAAAPVAAPQAAAPVVSAPAPVVPAAPAADAVTSPMVGVVYLCPEPGASPFVKPGQAVNVGDTLLIIEAMKVMNPIKATQAGTVVEVCVADASPVEFGQPLVRVA